MRSRTSALPVRPALLVVAALLAVAGVAALVAGHRAAPAAQPPLVAQPSLVAEPSLVARPPQVAGPSPMAASSSTAPGELTTGPLMASSPPTEVRIPALQVDASVIGLGQQADGSMAVPADAKTIGWYTKAPTPGSLGPAVLAGHVNLHGRDGTFARLSTLKPGDPVRITRQDGSDAVFAVTRVDRYAKNHFPAGDVYGAIDHAGLRLITCGGDFDDASGHYQDNIVVYADLRTVSPAGAAPSTRTRR